MQNLLLGLDSEVVVATKRGVLYPHVARIAQERTSFDQPFDWHGDGYAWELCVQPDAAPIKVVERVAQGLMDLHLSWGTRNIVGPSMYAIADRIARTAPLEVSQLGCMPSFNLYGEAAKPKGLPKTLRTTGCHIHASSPDMTKHNYANVIMWSDVLVGSAWTYVSPETAFDERNRRKYYGRAGEHRVRWYNKEQTLFGVEYRSLPGGVLHHPDYLHLMLTLMQEAAKRAVNGPPEESLVNHAVDTVNRADKRGEVLGRALVGNSGLRDLIEQTRKVKSRNVDLIEWKRFVV